MPTISITSVLMIITQLLKQLTITSQFPCKSLHQGWSNGYELAVTTAMSSSDLERQLHPTWGLGLVKGPTKTTSQNAWWENLQFPVDVLWFSHEPTHWNQHLSLQMDSPNISHITMVQRKSVTIYTCWKWTLGLLGSSLSAPGGFGEFVYGPIPTCSAFHWFPPCGLYPNEELVRYDMTIHDPSPYGQTEIGAHFS